MTLCGQKEEFHQFRVHFVFAISCSIAMWTTHKTVALTLLFPSFLGSHFPMEYALGVFSYNSFWIGPRKTVHA